MKNTTELSKSTIPFGLAAFGLSLMFGFASCASAQTLVAGNISGTWTLAGSPYVVVDNCTVPSGTILTIQPGVTVTIGENLAITANGLIQAVGTPSQRITFQAPISAQYWSSIFLIHESGTNRFKYCDLVNANTALTMIVTGWKRTMNVEVMNCRFSNCISNAIIGQGEEKERPVQASMPR